MPRVSSVHDQGLILHQNYYFPDSRFQVFLWKEGLVGLFEHCMNRAYYVNSIYFVDLMQLHIEAWTLTMNEFEPFKLRIFNLLFFQLAAVA